MTILALEFSTEQRSVACSRDGLVLGAAKETGGRSTQAIFLIQQALKQAAVSPADIEVIALGLGPGSYTGIRAALAVAAGWHLMRPVQFFGLSSVACLAVQAQTEGWLGRVHFLVDAQRGDVYHSSWQISDGALTESDPLKIIPASEVAHLASESAILAGPEITRWHPHGKTLFPTASVLARLASQRNSQWTSLPPEPIYLRETTFVKAPPCRTF